MYLLGLLSVDNQGYASLDGICLLFHSGFYFHTLYVLIHTYQRSHSTPKLNNTYTFLFIPFYRTIVGVWNHCLGSCHMWVPVSTCIYLHTLHINSSCKVNLSADAELLRTNDRPSCSVVLPWRTLYSTPDLFKQCFQKTVNAALSLRLHTCLVASSGILGQERYGEILGLCSYIHATCTEKQAPPSGLCAVIIEMRGYSISTLTLPLITYALSSTISPCRT